MRALRSISARLREFVRTLRNVDNDIDARLGPAMTSPNVSGPDVPPPSPDYRASEGQGTPEPPRTPLARMIARVRGILLAPRREWPLIDAETTTPAEIYLHYVAPLAAVGAIASSLGAWLVGIPAVPYGDIRLGPGAALAGAFLHLALQFATVFVVALIVNALAPTFGGRKDSRRALQVTAYSFTPAWVAALLTILPTLGALASLIGLYGLYLLYTGLPVLMQATRDRTLGYTVVIVICTVAITVAVATASGLLLGVLMPPDIGVPESGTARV
jgi:hypothetical protein